MKSANESVVDDDDPQVLLESLDVGKDFELVEEGGNVDRKLLATDTKEDKENQDKEEEYRELVDKMKNEIEPFKDELLNDQKVLSKLHSNLIDENVEQGWSNESEPTKSAVEDPAAWRLKISSMKYDLESKDKKIDELQKKINSFHEKLNSAAADSEASDSLEVQCILLLKKELELIDESGSIVGGGSGDKGRSTETLDVIVQNSPNNFWFLFIGSCFHVINAVLIVILLSIYYGRESYMEKRFTIAAIIAVYVTSNFIAIRMSRSKAQTIHKKAELTKVLARQATLMLASLTGCLLLVFQVAQRYEDSSTFIYHMVCLVGLCFLSNAVLVLIVCRLNKSDSKTTSSSSSLETKKQI